MKVFNLVMSVLFLLSAVVQYNDPDPFIWVPLYLLGVYLCFEAFKKRMNRALYLLALIIYVPYAVYLFFNEDGVLSWWNEHQAENIAQSMKATKPWIEETREFFGLMLLIAAVVINWLWLKNKTVKHKKAVHG